MKHSSWSGGMIVIASALLHGCVVNDAQMANDVACVATGDTYRYANANGDIISIVDQETAFETSGAGIRSADVESLSFFVSRDASGALVRNYAAINSMILSGSQWSGGGLECAGKGMPNSVAFDVTCRNGYGDIHGYQFSPDIGLTEIFLVIADQKYSAKLVGSKGLLWNCEFKV